MMIDDRLVQEFKDRLADRYTASEIAELLDIPVEDLIETYWDKFPLWILEEVGYKQD